MRIAVTGKSGQVVTALRERAGDVDIIALARPELDLAHGADVQAILRAIAPDAIVSAAAYTAVDRAENEAELAHAVNGEGPGHLASAAAAIGIPVVHLSTDYVFDGSKPAPYVETDQPAPLGVYGRTKLAGERAVAAATADYAILRTAWVYSPFGANFVKTMLHLARGRPDIRVVGDQLGNPTSAFDIADAILKLAGNLVRNPHDAALRGTFHMTASGEASWAKFATEIFAVSAVQGGPAANVTAIATADYPTAAKRPANSRLDCSKLLQQHGLVLPHWRESTALVVERLVA